MNIFRKRKLHRLQTQRETKHANRRWNQWFNQHEFEDQLEILYNHPEKLNIVKLSDGFIKYCTHTENDFYIYKLLCRFDQLSDKYQKRFFDIFKHNHQDIWMYVYTSPIDDLRFSNIDTNRLSKEIRTYIIHSQPINAALNLANLNTEEKWLIFKTSVCAASCIENLTDAQRLEMVQRNPKLVDYLDDPTNEELKIYEKASVN